MRHRPWVGIRHGRPAPLSGKGQRRTLKPDIITSPMGQKRSSQSAALHVPLGARTDFR